jgi:hypothetical protein
MQRDRVAVQASSVDDVVERVVSGLISEPDPLVRYDVLTRAQEMYDAVVMRVAAERARAVADMHATGLSYGRIAEVIGFTRARAQQLVERGEPTPKSRAQQGFTSVATQEEITTFLASYIEGWPRVYYSTAYSLASRCRPPLMAHIHTAQEIAAHLFADAQFRSLQLGTWLDTPNGELIAAAVEAVTPPPYREDIQLLVEAVTLAAKMQQDAGRERAVAAGLVLAFGSALLAANKG